MTHEKTLIFDDPEWRAQWPQDIDFYDDEGSAHYPSLQFAHQVRIKDTARAFPGHHAIVTSRCADWRLMYLAVLKNDGSGETIITLPYQIGDLENVPQTYEYEIEQVGGA